MAEIELVEKKSFSSKETLEEDNEEEVLINQKTNKPFFLLTIFALFIVITLFINVVYRILTSNGNSLQKPNMEKAKFPEKIKKPVIIPYETPNKLEGLLDFLLYPYHSDIIKDLDDYEFIRDSLGKISLKMIFNSDYHGDYAIDVHTRANTHHILVLIETEKGNRFGGYTSENFTPRTFGLTSTSIELYKKDNSAFLFNLDAKAIYNIKPKEADKALDCDDYFTFCFGEGDLVLRDQFLTEGGISTFPGYYGDENTKENELTNGEKEFEIKTFEIYEVLFFSEFGDENNKMGIHKKYTK